MPTLTIDERTVTVPDGATVLQAVRLAGAPLPTLCHWEGLPPYGRVSGSVWWRWRRAQGKPRLSPPAPSRRPRACRWPRRRRRRWPCAG